MADGEEVGAFAWTLSLAFWSVCGVRWAPGSCVVAADWVLYLDDFGAEVGEGRLELKLIGAMLS